MIGNAASRCQVMTSNMTEQSEKQDMRAYFPAALSGPENAFAVTASSDLHLNPLPTMRR
jgi:hypothetical protein